MKFFNELFHLVSKKVQKTLTGKLKEGIPTQSVAIFHVWVVFTSYLQRWCKGNVPTSKCNQNVNIWFYCESAAIYIRLYYRQK